MQNEDESNMEQSPTKIDMEIVLKTFFLYDNNNSNSND